MNQIIHLKIDFLFLGDIVGRAGRNVVIEKLSKLIGQEISKSKNNDSPEVNNLKKKGNEYRTKISEFEEKKRTLDKNIHNEICNLPNLPSKDAPIGKDESDNVQVKTWGDPFKKENIKSHWEIGENLNLFDFIKSTKMELSLNTLFVFILS